MLGGRGRGEGRGERGMYTLMDAGKGGRGSVATTSSAKNSPFASSTDTCQIK